jgi:hypothetical protein
VGFACLSVFAKPSSFTMLVCSCNGKNHEVHIYYLYASAHTGDHKHTYYLYASAPATTMLLFVCVRTHLRPMLVFVCVRTHLRPQMTMRKFNLSNFRTIACASPPLPTTTAQYALGGSEITIWWRCVRIAKIQYAYSHKIRWH